MIKINLLPPEAGKRAAGGKAKRKGSGAMTPFVLGLLLLFGGAGYLGWRSYDKYTTSKAAVASAKAKLAELEKEIKSREKEFQAQLAEKEEIDAKFAVVQALNPPNRLFWSEKLNQLALAQTKAAVYLTKLSMTERVEEVETPESKARRAAYDAKVKKPGSTEKPPPVDKAPIIWQTLTIEGIAYGTNSPQRLQQISLFMESLKNLEWTRNSGDKTTFFTGMNPNLQTLPHKAERVGGIDVLSFGFRIAANQQQASATEAEKPAAVPPAPPGAPAGGKK